jgi:tetratricopeptide (TPR) repeat protein
MGRTLLYQGSLADGDRAIALARSLEPFSPVYSVWLGRTRAWLGHGEQALAELRRAWDLDSNSALVQNASALAFLEQGEQEMAQRIARRPAQAALLRGTLGYVLVRTGAREEALRLMRTIVERDGRAWLDQLNLSLLYLGLGDTARALDAMELGVDRGEPVAAFHPLSAPMYDPVRSSPRFAALLRRVGLDPAILTAPRGGRVP